MSDELVKRLRGGLAIGEEAADRIEELEKRNASLEAKLAKAFSEALEDMLTIAIDALKKIAACDDDNVAKYIQTVDTLALNALDALKERLK